MKEKQMEALKCAAGHLADKLVQTRRELHQIPELAFCEVKTAAYICSKLEQIGIPYQSGVAQTGVVALIESAPGAKTLLLRADMDALPMQEDRTRVYCSQHDGVMHACGHDGHVAVLLGVAELLWERREELSCNVKLVFQPAEEDTGGAGPMIEAGVLDAPKVDAALALHIMNEVECGKVRVRQGAVMASPDEFDLTIEGRGGHGAYPQECVDPIVIASQVVTAFSVLASRFTSPFEPVVISVCSINGGSFYNIIPEKVSMRGTVRLYDNALRQEIPKRMEQIVKQYTEAYGAGYEWDYRKMFPPLVNDDNMVTYFRVCASEILGEENVLEGGQPSMAGDDFAYFAERVPSVYFHLGAGNREKGTIMPLHSPDFDFDESCLVTGVLAVSWFALCFGKDRNTSE